MTFFCALLVAHLLSCTIAEFIPTGLAALSPRDQLVKNPDNPPIFSDPKYRDLPCPKMDTATRRVVCTQYDSMITLKDLKELERYVDSELKAADGTFKKPDSWILVKDDNYWVNPARNKWLRFRKEVAPLKDWFKHQNNNFDERNQPKTTTTRRPPTSPGNVNPGSKTSAAASIERISFKLWSKCPNADRCSNTVYSPMSISSMLTLLMLGSNGATESELRSLLGYADRSSDSSIKTSYGQITDSINKRLVRDINNQLRVANAIFTFGTDVDSGYKEDVTKDFAGHFDTFQNVNRQAIDSINRWVSDQTNNKIDRVIDTLPASSRLVGVNTVYFKGKWLEPFGKEFTREADFHVTRNEKIQVQTMAAEPDIDYVEDSGVGCKMIALPYEDQQMAMYLVLPIQRFMLNEVETKLSADILEKLIGRMQETNVDVRLPKFRISQKFRLKERLISLGVKTLFTPQLADLKRMIPSGEAAVDDVVHEAFVQVSETGTEAAAATTVFLTRGVPSKMFIADQPFLFFIRDKSTKVVYFSGRVARPSSDN